MKHLFSLCVLWAIGVSNCFAVDLIERSARLPETAPWNLDKLSEAPSFRFEDDTGQVRSLFYAGESYRDKATRVFAYYATPGTLKGDSTIDKDLPAVVLVHGGGGTAFREWAELWAKRGYAAIAMDLAGYRPNETGSQHKRDNRQRLADGGPDQRDDEKFGSINKPADQQWPYHAVANVLLAHSLIRSFPEVDPNRTAVTGISWGGYLTCIVAGLDNRFKAAVPVYGCGFLHENSAWLSRLNGMTPEQRDRWVSLWDPSRYLPAVSMPIFFVNGTNDFAYPLDSYMKSYNTVPGTKQIRITVKMPHGHPSGWAPREIGLFIDQHLLGSPQLATIASPTVVDEHATAKYKSDVPIESAELHFTTDNKPINQRDWHSQQAQIAESNVMSSKPPAEATAWFFTVKDSRGVITSSPVVGAIAE